MIWVTVGGRPRDINLTASQHHCTRRDLDFTADLSDLAPPKGHYTHRVVALAVRLVVEDGRRTRPPVGTSGETIASSSPMPPSRTGWRPGEKSRPTDPDELPGRGPGWLLGLHGRRRVVRRPLLRPVDRG